MTRKGKGKRTLQAAKASYSKVITRWISVSLAFSTKIPEAESSTQEGPAQVGPQESKRHAKRQKRSNSPSVEDTESGPGPSGLEEEEVKIEEEDQQEEDDGQEPETLPTSDPCTCRCGGCCCHSTPEVKHCVRCHANYTFNHSEACQLPHVFDGDGGIKLWSRDLVNPSMCCGMRVVGADFEGGDVRWNLPSPCYSGWHTTDAQDVEYNGSSIVRCVANSKGKCKRPHPKHQDSLIREYSFEKVRNIDKRDRERRRAELDQQRSPAVERVEKDFDRARRQQQEERRGAANFVQMFLNPAFSF